MRNWIFNIWQLLKVCLGFIPALYMMLAIVILSFIFGVEHYYFKDIAPNYVIFDGDLETAQSLMNTLLQSMVTMVTFVVSVTMVVLSLAASQLGPRLIKSFVSNKTTHQYVGYFFCTVILCAVMIGILYNEDLSEPVPNFTISFVIVYCFISFCLLLGFINHVAKSCIADNMINRVYDHLCSSVNRITVKEEKLLKPNLPKSFDRKAQKIKSSKNGFVQNIDYNELLEIAAEHKSYVRIRLHAGDYVVDGQTALEYMSNEQVDEDFEKKLLKHLIIGNERTPTQDVEYSFRHLNEIGLRALSPGINDHTTAKIALNFIVSGLCSLYNKHLPNVVYNDEDNKCRIVGKPKYLEDLVEPCILPIMEAGQDKSDIMLHVLDKLEVLGQCDPTKEVCKVLKRLHTIAMDFIAINFKQFPELNEELKTRAADVKKYL